MDKLMWVGAPLALVLLGLAWQALQGRWPTRLALNVVFSLLLLGFVLTTAGLGIFWVAYQQLPVFDWHYLFGYATLLLVLVHLGFNARVVWQFLRRRLPGAAPPAATVPGRRPWLGLASLGWLAGAAGLGYLLGLRHGRTELQLAAGGTPAPATAGAVVESFHAHSTHSRGSALRRAASSGWALAPPPFKSYPQARRLTLPAPLTNAGRGAAPDLATLGSWLWLSAGVRERRGGIVFRTSPSSGALFSTELYVLALQVQGLAPGLWHYDADTHALQRLPDPPGATPLQAMGRLALPAGCHALVVASALFARSGHKYGDRTYRYVTADVGHTLENLLLAARAVGGAQARLLAAFDDLAVGRALGLDAAQEGVLALATLAAPAAEPAPEPTAWTSPVADAAGTDGARLGLTEAMQLATSLRAAASSVRSDHAPVRVSDDTTVHLGDAAVLQPLPAARRLQADWPQVIARRHSVRRFAATPLPLQALADVLQAMTAPEPQLCSAVRLHLLSAAVQGLPAAAWRHDPARQALVQRVVHGPALRQRARAAALDQDVIGDAAAVFVLSLDRAALKADPLGPARAYRHGFMEAGLLGERLYLAAGALGLGACAVGAFYDDEAAALVGIDPAKEWAVHFAALGVPA